MKKLIPLLENETTITLSEIFTIKVKLCQIIEDSHKMCKGYHLACNLEDCEMFNTNYK